ncbi:NUDIX hydrolase [Chryseomicrobium excrementi]|uniref:NUDIX hydrolase n=1 Tax=Chryseomicrobium excrementi TaxID=2041346 RepID=A0A2M9F1A3_9BACL|nr:NUDIX hydrolase [Chryseomicrobium excrementi]PJK17247.1 NUDIX hydrolase [Chryseomicrobium excrementi]
MSRKERGNVWLGVAGIVINTKGEWLVVQKRYGGLNGKWSLPAGFVEGTETVDQAVLREIKEETGIDAQVIQLIGFRSGVIKEKISDNMAIFFLRPVDPEQVPDPQLDELYEAKWMTPQQLLEDERTTSMIKVFLKVNQEAGFETREGLDPGPVFGYSSYKLFTASEHED